MILETSKFILINKNVSRYEQLSKSINVAHLIINNFENIVNIDNFFSNNSLTNLTHFAFIYDNNYLWMPFFPTEQYFGYLFEYFTSKLVALNNSSIVIDIITCNINKPDQIKRLAGLQATYNVTIRYSLNATGNYHLGGDWILESDNVNIKDTYFNENINTWNYNLGIGDDSTSQYEKLMFDISGNQICLHTDICGNPINMQYDLSGVNIKYPAGRVTTLGTAIYGTNGESLTSPINVYDQVQTDVVCICPGIWAYSAIKSDGSVVAWGDPNRGGDMSSVSAQLQSNVVALYASAYAHVALKSNGGLVVWGDISNGGSMTNFQFVSGQLQSNVKMVFSTQSAFAALKKNGSVITWGNEIDGGNSFEILNHLTRNIVAVYSTGFAFAILKVDGSVITWGNPNYGGDSSSVSAYLQSDVVIIYSNQYAFAAVKTNGSVITWGSAIAGGDSTSVSSQLQSNVKFICNTTYAFAALKTDGSVITWGSNGGADSSSVSSLIQSDVVSIVSNSSGFAILKSYGGGVVIWGDPNSGIDISTISSQLQSNIKYLQGIHNYGYIAVKNDGTGIAIGPNTTSFISGEITGVYGSGYGQYLVLRKNQGTFVGISDVVDYNFTTTLVKQVASNYTSLAVLSHYNKIPIGQLTILGQSYNGELLTVINTISDIDGVSGHLRYNWTIGDTISGTYTIINSTIDISNYKFMTLSSHIGRYIRVNIAYTDFEGTQENIISNHLGPILITPNNILPPGQGSYSITIDGTPQTLIPQSSISTIPDNSIGVTTDSTIITTISRINRTYVSGDTLAVMKTTYSLGNLTNFISSVKSASQNNIYNIIISRTVDSVPVTTNANYITKADGSIIINDLSNNQIINIDLSGSDVSGITDNDLLIASLTPVTATDLINNIGAKFYFKLIDLSTNTIRTSGFRLPITFELPNSVNVYRVLLYRFNEGTQTWDFLNIVAKNILTNLFTYTFTSNSDYIFNPILAGGAGDPHINTINGELYDLPNVNAKFLLFDNNKIDNLRITCICKTLTPLEIITSKFINNFVKSGTFISQVFIEYNGEELEIDMKTLTTKGIYDKIFVTDIYSDINVFRHNYSWIKIYKYRITFNGSSKLIVIDNKYRIKVSLDLNCADHRNGITIDGPNLESGYGALVSQANSLLVNF